MERHGEAVEHLTETTVDPVADAYWRGVRAMRDAVRSALDAQSVPRSNFGGFFLPAFRLSVVWELQDQLDRLHVPPPEASR